ncbi:MAG TPA: EutN/CcmL family microcompartment protein [Pirellulales bacterium]|nr:EutN/CcmL family microcompartment protein [Pirellulales bacterium]
MQLGIVVGTATATVKHRSMEGWKLLLVQLLSADGRSPDGEPVLAVDRLGAGRGETVMLSSDGKGTCELLKSETTPVRYSVMGIPDRGAPNNPTNDE